MNANETIVTTGNLKSDYEINGQVCFQTNKREETPRPLERKDLPPGKI